MLQIRLLGQFDVRVNGGLLEIPSRPAQSLLAFLLLNPGVAFRREMLAGKFWPDTLDESARQNLRSALWNLRKAFNERQLDSSQFLRADDLTIRFTPPQDFWLDVRVLDPPGTAFWTPETLIESVSACGGVLLPGFYDDWIIPERERLQMVFDGRMQQLLDRLVEDHRWRDVLTWGSNWVSSGSAPEPAYRALMTTYHALGDRASLGAIFQRCVEILETELGVGPSEQTLRLYQTLTENMPSEPGPARADPGVGGVTASSTAAGGSTSPNPPLSPAASEELAPAPGSPPYKGLQYFEQGDENLFFGREEETARLIARLQTTHFLAIIGASGSGKSSLLRGGLFPALLTARQPASPQPAGGETSISQAIVLTPTDHPLEALATELTRDLPTVVPAAGLIDDMQHDPRSLRLFARKAISGAGRPAAAGGYLALFVDQFEELFTLCKHEAERLAFIENLLNAAEGYPVKVVIALRADFYVHCASYPRLRQAIAASQEFIGPLSPEALCRAIEEPARRNGWAFEPGLVDLLLREVGSTSFTSLAASASPASEAIISAEPGALPLLSHTLLETWKRRQGRRMTLAGYAATGGVHGAIARTAESIHARLSPVDQGLMRRILIRLTELGEGVQDTRRRANLEELISQPEEAPQVERLIKLLTDARLLTASEQAIEVAHEALIREWPTLRGWLAENRESLQQHRRLTHAAQEWHVSGREASELYRGSRLAQALEWQTAHDEELNPLERQFLVASYEKQEQEVEEHELQRQRELESAGKLAEAEAARAAEQARTSRRLRILAAVLATLLLAAIFLTGSVIQQRNRAAEQTRLANSRELAASAVSNLEVDPERSILLALLAVKTDDIYQAEDALHQSLQASRLLHVLNTGQERATFSAFSPDGSLLAVQAKSRGHADVQIWDPASWKLLRSFPGSLPGTQWTDASRLTAKVFWSGDGPGARRMVAFYNPLDGQVLSTQLIDPLDHVNVEQLSPDGRLLGEAGGDGRTFVRDLTNGKTLLTLGKPGDAASYMVAFSPDSRRLVTSLNNQTAVFDIATGNKLVDLPSVSIGDGPGVYSPDGKRLALSLGPRVIIVDADTGQVQLTLGGHQSFYFQIAFSPDQSKLAAGTSDGFAFVWDATTGQELFRLAGHSSLVNGVTFTPDGRSLITSSYDGTLRVWDISPSGSRESLAWDTPGQAPLTAVTYSPDGSRLAATGGSQTASIWDTASGKLILAIPGSSETVGSLAFSPDGKYLATTSGDNAVKIWDVASGQPVRTLLGHTAWVGDLAYSPNGKYLATIGYDKNVILWNADSGQEIYTRQAYTEDNVDISQNIAITFSPDGKRFATAGGFRAKIWETASGNELLSTPEQEDFVYSVAFSPDGKRLAFGIAVGHGASIIDAGSGKELVSLVGHKGSVQAIEFSHDGQRIYTGGVEGSVRVWDANTGNPLLFLTRQEAQISGIALSPDESQLAVTNINGVATLIDLHLDDLLRHAQARLTRGLTQEECQVYLHTNACPPAGP